MTAAPEGTDSPTAAVGPIILCDASSPQSGTALYHIGYIESVDGYRHAWTEVSPSGRRKLRHGRTPSHPSDPRCPGCASLPGVTP